ncbi:MAG: DivIVA domain-containing protein [Wujia sp.]
MLTPVDIQQKKFHVGLGYDKKDVNTFFDAVAESYEQLYRSNAELKEKVLTLTDSLQHYKSKESELEKSLMLAEKDSEDTKTNATREAKTIVLDAKNKAKIILEDAEKRLEEITEQATLMETQYAAYKSNFSSLMKKQFELLKEEDFDVDAYIDEKALSLLGGSPVAQNSGNDSFGAFTGDPQMRDESTLGGMGSAGEFGSGGDINSTSAVYTSTLGANENFVDPFNPQEQNGRYNPFDGRTVTSTKKSGESTLKVSTPGEDRTKYKRTPVNAAKTTTA